MEITETSTGFCNERQEVEIDLYKVMEQNDVFGVGGSDVIHDAKYCGKTLLGKIDDELRVKLQFVYTGTRDHYNALRLKIINRTDGEVDAETFKFSDILGGNPAYQNNPFAREIHIWENNGKADWYGYHPSPAAYQKIADTVNDYISMYQEEDMGMTL